MINCPKCGYKPRKKRQIYKKFKNGWLAILAKDAPDYGYYEHKCGYRTRDYYWFEGGKLEDTLEGFNHKCKGK